MTPQCCMRKIQAGCNSLGNLGFFPPRRHPILKLIVGRLGAFGLLFGAPKLGFLGPHLPTVLAALAELGMSTLLFAFRSCMCRCHELYSGIPIIRSPALRQPASYNRLPWSQQTLHRNNALKFLILQCLGAYGLLLHTTDAGGNKPAIFPPSVPLHGLVLTFIS